MLCGTSKQKLLSGPDLVQYMHLIQNTYISESKLDSTTSLPKIRDHVTIKSSDANINQLNAGHGVYLISVYQQLIIDNNKSRFNAIRQLVPDALACFGGGGKTVTPHETNGYSNLGTRSTLESLSSLNRTHQLRRAITMARHVDVFMRQAARTMCRPVHVDRADALGWTKDASVSYSLIETRIHVSGDSGNNSRPSL